MVFFLFQNSPESHLVGGLGNHDGFCNWSRNLLCHEKEIDCVFAISLLIPACKYYHVVLQLVWILKTFILNIHIGHSFRTFNWIIFWTSEIYLGFFVLMRCCISSWIVTLQIEVFKRCMKTKKQWFLKKIDVNLEKGLLLSGIDIFFVALTNDSK